MDGEGKNVLPTPYFLALQETCCKRNEDDSFASSTHSLENSSASNGSKSFIGLADDPLSSSTSASPSQLSGPLHNQSELMAQLPIRRGISKFYLGKAQSLVYLSAVKRIEDIAKKKLFVEETYLPARDMELI